MELYKKITKKIAEIRDSILGGFSERSLYQINELMKLNEDSHNTMYAELGDIDRIANVEKGYVSGTGFEKDEKTGVSFCGQLLNLPVESDDAWREANDELTDIVLANCRDWAKEHRELKDFILVNGHKYPVDSPIASFEINGEKFELNEGEGVRVNTGADFKPVTISSFVNHTAWENPKFVWQWERKSERQQKAILEILNSCNP